MAFPAGKRQEQPEPKRVPVPWLCLPVSIPVLCGPCAGSETSAHFLGLPGPRFNVLGACLNLMAPVFTFYYSQPGSEKESWERSEFLHTTSSPRCSSLSRDVPAVPKQPPLGGVPGVLRPQHQHI